MNSPAPTFDAEQARLAAAAHLQPEHFVEFQRLAKSLIHGPQFQLLIVDCRDERLRNRLLQSLSDLQQQVGLRGVDVAIEDSVAGDVSKLEIRLIEAARNHDVIHMLGANVWMDDAAWQSFNLVRERLALHVRVRLVLWLNEEAIARIARHAPDIWAWRSGIYLFSADGKAWAAEDLQLQSLTSADRVKEGFDNRSMRERYQRISEIRSMLGGTPEPSEELRGPMLAELGLILGSLGQYQEVISLVEEEFLPLADKLRDESLAAESWVLWADAKLNLGEIDLALDAYRHKVLPIRVSRGDERESGMTWGRIAHVLRAKGEMKEALRILSEEVLPVYENLGDMQARAETMGRMADMTLALGESDLALRIWREKVLPVYEKLGDLHSRAMTMGRIADVLFAQGELEGALRIRREEELPVFEKLGSSHNLLVGRTKLALCMKLRGRMEDLPEIERLLRQAYAEAQRLELSEARQIAKIFEQILGVKIDGV
jgi:tetratricopeptide (TPR) repeat protein